jgi:hypothetical protein
VIEGLWAWSGRACTCAAQPAGTAELIHQRGSAPCCACRFFSFLRGCASAARRVERHPRAPGPTPSTARQPPRWPACELADQVRFSRFRGPPGSGSGCGGRLFCLTT